jgi:RNA polymerase sigma-70 factor (ECF subfamily)
VNRIDPAGISSNEGSGEAPISTRARVEAARSGDARATEALLAAEVDAVYRLALAIVGNDADARDVTQETMVTAWRQVGRLREADRFDVWLRRIAVNAARMHLRSRRRRGLREIPASEVDRRFDDPSVDPVSGRPDALVLRAALSRLDADRRVLLALHYLEGHPVAELAQILGIPPGTVKSRLSTARGALRSALEAEGG